MTQPLLKYFLMLGGLIFMFAASSCDTILQYPDGEGDDTTHIRTRVELAVDFTPVSDPLLASYADARAGDFDVRYQVAIYAVSGAKAGRKAEMPVERKVWTANVLETGPTTVATEVDLHAGLYEVYAWIDFVPCGTTEDHHYITTDPRKVFLADPNVCGLDTRDAFSGKTQIDLSQYRDAESSGVTVTVDMERPFGKFKIVTTDVKKFLESYKAPGTYADIVPARTNLRYNSYFPTAYNLDTGYAHIDEYKMGVNHTAVVMEQEDNKATLSYNYVFICNDNTTVNADIEVRNKDGEHLTTTRNIRIPVQRNKLTIVEGEFLTKDYGSGEMGINDRFDEEFVVIVPD